MSFPYIRLWSYRTYLPDGRGFAEYRAVDQQKVFVAILVGVEPRKIVSQSDYFNADDVILAMAESIKQAREEAKTTRKTTSNPRKQQARR